MAMPWYSSLAVLLLVGGAGADDIRALQQQQEQLRLVRGTLQAQRGQLAFQADILSARIDSLKAAAAESEELHQALRVSMGLVQGLMALDQRLDSLAGEHDGLEDRLRLAYDWEIGGLIQQLSREPDKERLLTLMVYQEARAALGDRLPPSWLRYGQEMSVGPDDGPDQIRQKIDYMEEIAGRLQAESRETVRRLRQLEQEGRVRAQVRTFTSQIALFDEHRAEGRVLQRVEAKGALAVATGGEAVAAVPSEGGADMRAGAAPNPEDEGLLTGPGPAPQEVLRARSQAVREGEHLTPGQYAAGDLFLEMRKLRARQQEIHQMEVVLGERLRLFQHHLQELLEGSK